MILQEYTKEGLKVYDANYERFLWNQLKNDPKYITTKKSKRKRKEKYTDNY